MPPRTRRTTHQPEQPQPEQVQVPAPPATDETTEMGGHVPQDGVPAADANDLLAAIAADTEPAEPQPRVACLECTPPGGLPAAATAFACVHGSWDLT